MSVFSEATPLERRRFWLLLLIALVVIGAGMGLRDPWPSDEPRSWPGPVWPRATAF